MESTYSALAAVVLKIPGVSADVLGRIVAGDDYGAAGLGQIRMQCCVQSGAGRRPDHDSFPAREFDARAISLLVGDRNEIVEQVRIEDLGIVLIGQPRDALQAGQAVLPAPGAWLAMKLRSRTGNVDCQVWPNRRVATGRDAGRG